MWTRVVTSGVDGIEMAAAAVVVRSVLAAVVVRSVSADAAVGSMPWPAMRICPGAIWPKEAKGGC